MDGTHQPLFREQHATILRVQDFDAMVAWYQDVLALPLLKRQDEISLAVFDLPGPSYLCLYAMEDGTTYTREAHPKCLLNWRSDDLKQTRQWLLDQGVECGELMGFDGFQIFRFYDPEGTTHDCCWYDERYLPEK